MACSFPQEILDVIVAELDDGSLKQCSLSSWSLLLPARRSRFRSISIFQGEVRNKQGSDKLLVRGYRKLLNLVQILENDPSRLPSRTREGCQTLASCIRWLELGIASNDSRAFDEDAVFALTMSPQGQQYAASLPLPVVLDRLAHVESVWLHSSHASTTIWCLVDPTITSAIVKFLRFPTIKALAINHIHGFPADTIIHCPNLSDLTLDGVHGDDSTDLINILAALQSLTQPVLFEPSYPPPSLERLHSRASEAFLTTLINTPRMAVAFKNLRELFLQNAAIHVFRAELLAVNAVASTLQILRISGNLSDHDGNGSSAIEYLDLSRLPRLITLDIAFKQKTELPFTHSLMPRNLIKFLGATSATMVEVLNLTIAWKYLFSIFEDLILSHQDWDDLDELLTGPTSKYPALKDVSIGFDVDFDELEVEEPDFYPLDEATARVSPKLRACFHSFEVRRAST